MEEKKKGKKEKKPKGKAPEATRRKHYYLRTFWSCFAKIQASLPRRDHGTVFILGILSKSNVDLCVESKGEEAFNDNDRIFWCVSAYECNPGARTTVHNATNLVAAM